jgi:peptidoglycan hydrolase-like protein with peptidoglycan-binding domain
MAILRKGLSGEPVRRLQAKLGAEADGAFGDRTEKMLKDWQAKHGLAADGVAGPDTFLALGLPELVLLKTGTRGSSVKKLQEKLGIGADGSYGPGTERAVREYQEKNGLKADGMAGPATLAHMQLFKEITAETVKSSQVGGAEAPKTAAADAAPRSLWDTIKGVFQ